MNKPRFATRVDENHAEIRYLFKECAVRFPLRKIKVIDTSNMGGRLGDLIVQFLHIFPQWTHLADMTMIKIIEIKRDEKAKLTDSQENNELELTRIDDRAGVFALLSIQDWK